MGIFKRVRKRLASFFSGPRDSRHAHWRELRDQSELLFNQLVYAKQKYLQLKIGDQAFSPPLRFCCIVPDTSKFSDWPTVDMDALDILYQGIRQLQEELNYIIVAESEDLCCADCLSKLEGVRTKATTVETCLCKVYEKVGKSIPEYVSNFKESSVNSDTDAFIATHPDTKIPTLKTGTLKVSLRDVVLLDLMENGLFLLLEEARELCHHH